MPQVEAVPDSMPMQAAQEEVAAQEGPEVAQTTVLVVLTRQRLDLEVVAVEAWVRQVLPLVPAVMVPMASSSFATRLVEGQLDHTPSMAHVNFNKTQIAAWLGWAGWLYGFSPMAAAMTAARASSDPQGEPATTGLPAAMDEARLRQNYQPFALSWALFLAASGLPPADLAEIVGKATACHLPAEFVAALQPAATGG